jgi:hypothetical protein
MFYWMAVPAIILLAFDLRYLYRMRKDDIVLYRFCELRRHTVQLIADNAEGLTADDYLYARYMLEVMNSTVSAFKRNRHLMFNLRAFIRFLRRYKLSAEDIARVPRTQREDLMKIEREFAGAMGKGFIAYTPFMRSELAVRLLALAASFVASVGIKAVSGRAREFRDLLAATRERAASLKSLTITAQHPAHC